MTNSFSYIGEELDLFALATNWKRYWHSKISPYLGSRVLEVGAGIGGTTRVLLENNARFQLWYGLEPDAAMAEGLQAAKSRGEYPDFCEFHRGTVATLQPDQKFDTALYIDVLEHIEHDGAEIAQVAEHLEDNGYLVVLSPAYPFLYSEFDKALGHYRRYTRHMLEALTAPTLQTRKAFYLDSVGVLTSLGNRLVMHASAPTKRQILVWDRVLVPISSVVDRLLFYQFGRSVVYVWQKKAHSSR